MIALPQPVELLGVKVHPISQSDLIEILVLWTQQETPRAVFYVNAHAMNLSYEQRRLRYAFNAADLVFCDGMGVKLAGSFLNRKIPHRMTPPDWIDAFLERLHPDTSLYLLGDEESVVRQCAEVVQQRHPHLSVVGWHSGFFDVEGEKGAAVRQEVAGSGADVLLVGMGMPRQELWINDNLADLNVRVAVTVGALFQYYLGAKRRAPRWMTDHGLEWLGRLMIEPGRLFKRYVAGNPKFFFRVLRERRVS